MKLKKIIAAFAASAVALSAMAVSVFAQDTTGMADGTAYLELNTVDWSDPGGTYNNVEITGNGTYTVSMTGAPECALGAFYALQIHNGEVKFGGTYLVTINEIKVNGQKIFFAEGYTCSKDYEGVTTRVNLYNEYNTPTEANCKAGYPDCRCEDGDVMSKTAQMVDPGDVSKVTDIEVTFTVSGIEEAASPAETAAESAPAPESTPAADSDSASAGTGNASAAVILSVMAIAGAASVISRKRK